MTGDLGHAGPPPGRIARLRILVVAPAYPSSTSIAGVFVADQVAALRRDHDVSVIVPEPRGWRIALRGGTGTPADESRSPDGILRPIARTWFPRSPRSIADGVIRAVAHGYASATRIAAPDVIHAHVIHPIGFAAVKVGERHGIPVVVTEHSGPFAATVTSPYARQAATWTIDHAARVLAVGPDLRDDLQGFAPGRRIDIVENVVDTEFFHPAADEPGDGVGALRLFSLGIQAPQKATEVLLRAVGALTAAGVLVDLVIGGDGPERPGLEAEARRLGIEMSVRFVGIQSREEVRRWLWWCDMLVSASRRETFGLTIAEALACERPVVATRSGGPEAFVEPTFAVLVDRDDPTALAAAISSVAAREIVLDGRAGRRRIEERFGRVAFLDKIGRVYGEVLKGADAENEA